jgi:hypothetical protein
MEEERERQDITRGAPLVLDEIPETLVLRRLGNGTCCIPLLTERWDLIHRLCSPHY